MRAAHVLDTKKSVLSAIVAEAFYAVHPKAQRRVPLPEGLDLSTPFNEAALDALMDMRDLENTLVSNVSFIRSIATSSVDAVSKQVRA